jgi:hypothetical protein
MFFSGWDFRNSGFNCNFAVESSSDWELGSTTGAPDIVNRFEAVPIQKPSASAGAPRAESR